MCRTKLALLLAVAGWFAAACTSDQEAPPLAPSFDQIAAAPTSSDIFAKIDQLFPASPALRTAARSQFTNIVRCTARVRWRTRAPRCSRWSISRSRSTTTTS